MRELRNHGPCELIACLAVAVVSGLSSAQDLVPDKQKPLLKLLPPGADQRSNPGVGKFVIFTRERVGKDWDFIAGAWECIPSEPDTAITKRIEFCRSSWNATQLLHFLVQDESRGLHPRFVRLKVDQENKQPKVNIYDINYRTWDARCIWQGDEFSAFSVLNNAIICNSSDGWMRLDSTSGAISKDVPFEPLWVDGEHWVVKKPDDPEGNWSYNRGQLKYVARFAEIDRSPWAVSRTALSEDGESMAWVLLPWRKPGKWRGGLLAGKLVLQRKDQKDDLAIPVEFWSKVGSGLPLMPLIHNLEFGNDGKLVFCASITEDRSRSKRWEIDIATGQSTRAYFKTALDAIAAG